MTTLSLVCPIECVKSGCPSEPGWLEKHNGFLLTLIGLLGGGCGVLLTYFLKSRCKKIRCCGLECDRTPIELNADNVHSVIEVAHTT